MNKFQRMSGGEPRGHGLAEAVHLAPDTLRPLSPGDPVTLMTTQTTTHCTCTVCALDYHKVSFIPLNCTNNNAKSSVSKFKQE